MRRSTGNVTSLSLRQRMLSLSCGVALNAAALALLLALHSRPLERTSKAGASVISLIALAAPTKATVPAIIIPKFAALQVLPAPAPKPAGDAASAPDSADSCAILDSVAKAIVADPATVDAIVHAPAGTRSIADAIVIWNVGWSAATVNTGAPLEPVRANVVATLEAAPADCLSSPVSGPRLVPVPNGDRTLFLVFGSGDWSWKSLMDPAPIETADDITGFGLL